MDLVLSKIYTTLREALVRRFPFFRRRKISKLWIKETVVKIKADHFSRHSVCGSAAFHISTRPFHVSLFLSLSIRENNGPGTLWLPMKYNSGSLNVGTRSGIIAENGA